MIRNSDPNNDLRWGIINRKRFEVSIKRAFEVFRDHCIEPVLIKGWAAGRYYPPNVPRYYSDIDLAVSDGDHERAKELVQGEAAPFGIDLHRELRNLDDLEWSLVFKRSQLVDLDGVPIRVLRAEDHLRVLSSHWLADGGAYRHKLLDIVYLIQNGPKDLDWELCLSKISAAKRSGPPLHISDR